MIGHDFPYLDTRDINLDWLLRTVKQLVADYAELDTKFDSLEKYVMDYFNSLNLNDELTEIIQGLIDDGTLYAILNEFYKNHNFMFDTPAIPYEAMGFANTIDYPSTQGGCVIDNGRIVQYVVSSDSTSGKLYFIGSTGEYIGEQLINLGHGNDFTYDYDNNRLYVTVEGNINVYTINDITLSLDSIITPDLTVIGIAYKGDNEFYVYINDNTIRSTTDFNTFITIVESVFDSDANFYKQGIGYDGEYIFVPTRSRTSYESVVFAYNNAGILCGSMGFARGWSELEWVDFYNNMMITGFYADNNNSILRKDFYKQKKDCFNREYGNSGKTSPLYVRYNNNAINRFANVLKGEVIQNAELLNSICGGIHNVCVRIVSGASDVSLVDIHGLIMIEASTLDTLTVNRCIMQCYGSKTVNHAYITDSMIGGLMRILDGTITNSTLPNAEIKNGTITNSFIALGRPDENSHINASSSILTTKFKTQGVLDRDTSSANGLLLPFATFTLTNVAVTTSFTKIQIGAYTLAGIAGLFLSPRSAVNGLDYYFNFDSVGPALYIKAAEATTITRLDVVYFTIL